MNRNWLRGTCGVFYYMDQNMDMESRKVREEQDWNLWSVDLEKHQKYKMGREAEKHEEFPERVKGRRMLL